MARTPEQTARIRARQRAYLMAYAAFASSKSTAWTPLRLFASGEIGAWYDPSDLTTMFQDSAGTTPVTAVGQAVGLIRDKSGNGNHASQSTSTSRPTYQSSGGVSWLAFDGTDDFLVTGTINPGSVDKAQVFAGVRKLSDATRSIVAETGTGSSNGTIAFEAPFSPSATYGLYSRGTIQVRISSTTEYPSPITNVASVIADISAPSILLRVNGAQNVTNSSTQGTGSYSSQALYIGRRGGTTLPFNGNIYSLVVRFSAANLSDSVISQAETWVNSKTGAY